MAEKQHYETTFIITPVITDTQLKETVERYAKYLKELGGEMVHHGNWGLRKLAYPIQKKNSGYYTLFEYKATGEGIAEFELELKRDENVIRFLTVKLDKYGIEHNDHKRKAAKSSKTTEKTAKNEKKQEA